MGIKSCSVLRWAVFLGVQSAFGAALVPRSATATASITLSTIPATITPAPTPFNGQVVPLNTCSYYNSHESQYRWNHPWCSLSAGDIQLTYWPTSGNASYPATIFNSALDYTFISPSVYMIIKTIYAWNPCGALGPTSSNAILAFDITDISTLVPYTDLDATTRMSTRQLTLDDLNHNCPKSINTAAHDPDHPMYSDYLRCNPYIATPGEIKRLGLPYWEHCGNVRNRFGINDPPFPVPALTGLFPATATPAATSPKSTPVTPAFTAPKVASELGLSSIAEVEPTTTPTPTEAATEPTTVAASPDPKVVITTRKGEMPTTAAAKTFAVASPIAQSLSVQVASHVAIEPVAATPEAVSPGAASTAGDSLTAAAPIVVVGPTTAAENPFPAPVTISALSSSTVAQQIVSLGASGLEIVNNPGGSTSIYAVPPIGATQVGVGVGPASRVMYQGLTVTMNAPARTVTNVVVVAYDGGISGASGSVEASLTPTSTGAAQRMRVSTGGLLAVALGTVILF